MNSTVTFKKLNPGMGCLTRYSVMVDGRKVGDVASRRVESYRKYGRLRWITGHPIRWAYARNGAVLHGFHSYSRGEAVGKLLRDAS